MDFFKSVFSDEPEPLQSDPRSSGTEKGRGSDSDPDDPSEAEDPNPDPDSEPESELSSMWSFGGLLRTLTAKSESVIETYRRDLQEFGTGLKKELEVAQGSLDEIGTTVIKGTAQIISQGKEAILAVDVDSSNQGSSQNQSFNSKRYSRFDAQVRAVQGDVSTYCEEPEDLSDYSKWKLGFDLKEKSEEIEDLFEENEAMESVYKRVVPSSVDHETFWFRYFYKVHKLKQAEDLRVKLVNRAIEEEELSWDVDDSDDEKDGKSDLKLSHDVVIKDEKSHVAGLNVEEKSSGHELKEVSESGVEDSNQVVKKDSVDDDGEVAKEDNVGKSLETSNEDVELKPDEKKVKSDQPLLPEEEDLGWDEIEDLSNIEDDSKRTTSTRTGSPSRADLRKRLSTAEEDEDLSWDIEDD